jgi:hypothetical protein
MILLNPFPNICNDNRDDNPVNDNRPKTLRSALTDSYFGPEPGSRGAVI